MEEEILTYQQILNMFREDRESIREDRESMRELRERFKETDERFKETDVKFKESDVRLKALENLISENSKSIERVSKDIGHLNNKFGAFNEALVFPSLEKLFAEQFKCKSISQRYQVLLNGNTFEIDMLAVSHDACYIIEIKSKYRKDDLKQLLKHIEKYRIHTPEHKDKKIYGVIVATDFNKDNIKELAKKGIYFITVSDDIIKLQESPEFTPHAW